MSVEIRRSYTTNGSFAGIEPVSMIAKYLYHEYSTACGATRISPFFRLFLLWFVSSILSSKSMVLANTLKQITCQKNALQRYITISTFIAQGIWRPHRGPFPGPFTPSRRSCQGVYLSAIRRFLSYWSRDVEEKKFAKFV